MPRSLAVLLSALVLALAACGEEERGQTPASGGGTGSGATDTGGGEPSETGGGGAPAQGVLQVDVTEDTLEPTTLSARIGQAVNFTNRSNRPVRLVAQGAEGFPEELLAGRTFTFRPDTVGSVQVSAGGGEPATIEIIDE